MGNSDVAALGLVVGLRGMWMLAFIGLHPFVVHLVNFNLDTLDFGVSVHANLERSAYDRLDKITDLVYYVAALSYCLGHLYELWYARYMVPFLAWRILGNLIFIATLEDFVLIIFPNVFQPLFALYTFLDLIQVDAWVRDTQPLNGILIGLITALKFGAEVLMHGSQADEEGHLSSDELMCHCTNGWAWLGERAGLLVCLLLLAIYVGLVRTANYDPPHRPEVKLRPQGWDRVPPSVHPSPFNLNPIVGGTDPKRGPVL